jgi:cell division protease FtsH
MTFGKKEEQIFLGRDFTQTKDYSEKTAIDIDTEIHTIIMEAYGRAKALLEANSEILHEMARILLEKEVLDGSEIAEIIKHFGKGNGAISETPATVEAPS